MNTPKGEGQIEIPEVAIKELEDILLPILKEEIVLIGRGRGTIMGYGGAAEKAAIAALRHLSPSIDRYPRWIRASERLPETSGVYFVKEDSTGSKWMWHTHNIKRHAENAVPIWWLEEEQPSESPAITEK